MPFNESDGISDFTVLCACFTATSTCRSSMSMLTTSCVTALPPSLVSAACPPLLCCSAFVDWNLAQKLQSSNESKMPVLAGRPQCFAGTTVHTWLYDEIGIGCGTKQSAAPAGIRSVCCG